MDGVTIQPQNETTISDKKKPVSTPVAEDSKLITKAEGDLKSNVEEILEQARMARSPEEGDDLLKPNNQV